MGSQQASALPSYLRDSSLRTLNTVVTRCDAAGELRWHVQLQDTVLFPGGGGQPCDLGYILPLTQASFATTATTATTTTTSGTDSSLSDNDSCTVVGDSYTSNSSSTHGVSGDATTLDPQQVGSSGAGGRVRVLSLDTAPDGTAVHEVDAPLPPGSLVRVELDWARRLDHMQQHTGQHLLSAVLEQLFVAPTTSWAMSALDGPDGEGPGAAAVSVTVRPPPGVDVTGREALGALEVEANRVVGQGRPVGVRVVQDVAQLPRLRGDLPDDSKLQGGIIRIVSIEGVDATACGGTHVSSTSQLQLVKMLRGERRAGGLARLYFVVGGRALAAEQQHWAELQDLAQALGRSVGALLPAVQQLQVKSAQAAAELKTVLEEAGAAVAATLAARAASGEQVLSHSFALGDTRFLSGVAQQVLSCSPDTCLLLTCKASVGGKEGCMLLAGPQALVQAAAPAVCERLGATGKVARGVLQGRLPSWSEQAVAGAVAAVQAVVQEQGGAVA